jgi:hypothetical protein
MIRRTKLYGVALVLATVPLIGVACGHKDDKPPATPVASASHSASAKKGSPPKAASKDASDGGTTASTDDGGASNAGDASDDGGSDDGSSASGGDTQYRTGVTSIDTLVTSDASSWSFPSQSSSPDGCAKRAGRSGDSATDFTALSTACGTATGALQYITPLTGLLDDTHKQDAFKVTLYAGLCYHVIGAGDGSMTDLDVRIQHGGDLLAYETETTPVAILGGDVPFCPKQTVDADVFVVLDGAGHGHYQFGIWATKK